jgi:hypothetical protein
VVGRIYLVYAESSASIPTLSTVIGSTTTGGIFTPTATGWTLVPRQYMPTPEFTLNVAIGRDTLKTSTVDFGFNGWLMDGQLSGNPTYLAVVVTFEIPTSGTELNVDSINLTTGSIPSRPIPMSKSQVLSQCQRYYEKSYNQTATPGIVSVSTSFIKPLNVIVFNVGGNSMFYQRTPFTIDFQTTKRTSPTVTLYSPSAGTSGRLDIVTNVNNTFSSATVDTISTKWTQTKKSTRCVTYEPQDTQSTGFGSTPTTTANTGQATAGMHYVADARLGIV